MMEGAGARRPHKVGRWSREEHERFLLGLSRTRDWKVLDVYVPTRTPTQIRTHAQKFFKKKPRGFRFPQEAHEPSNFGDGGRGGGDDDDDDDGSCDQAIGEHVPPSSSAAALAAAVRAAGAPWSYLHAPTHPQGGPMPASGPPFDGRVPCNGMGSGSYASGGWGAGGSGSSAGGFAGGWLPATAGGGAGPPLLGPIAALGGHHVSGARPLGDPRAAVLSGHPQQQQLQQEQQQYPQLQQQLQPQQPQQPQQQQFMMPLSEGDGMSGGAFGGADTPRLAVIDANPFENWPPSVSGELNEADLLEPTTGELNEADLPDKIIDEMSEEEVLWVTNELSFSLV